MDEWNEKQIAQRHSHERRKTMKLYKQWDERQTHIQWQQIKRDYSNCFSIYMFMYIDVFWLESHYNQMFLLCIKQSISMISHSLGHFCFVICSFLVCPSQVLSNAKTQFNIEIELLKCGDIENICIISTQNGI